MHSRDRLYLYNYVFLFFVILIFSNNTCLALSSEAIKILEELRLKTKNVSTDSLCDTKSSQESFTSNLQKLTPSESSISSNTFTIEIYNENKLQENSNKFGNKTENLEETLKSKLKQTLNSDSQKPIEQYSAEKSLKNSFIFSKDKSCSDSESILKSLEGKIKEIKKTLNKTTTHKKYKEKNQTEVVTNVQNKISLDVNNNKINHDDNSKIYKRFDEITDEELIKFAEKHVWTTDKAKKHIPPPTPPTKYASKIKSQNNEQITNKIQNKDEESTQKQIKSLVYSNSISKENTQKESMKISKDIKDLKELKDSTKKTNQQNSNTSNLKTHNKPIKSSNKTQKEPKSQAISATKEKSSISSRSNKIGNKKIHPKKTRSN